MKYRIAVLAIAVAGAAFAHEGVKDPQVKARMDLMGEVKEATAVLGAMAKGARPHDAAAADAARQALAGAAAQIGPAFAAPATDPKSEALPAIWEDWDTFTASAVQMQRAAEAMDASTLEGLRAGMGPLAGSCRSCHEDFRAAK